MVSAASKATPKAKVHHDAPFAWSSLEELQLVKRSASEIWRVGGNEHSWLEWWQERLFLSSPTATKGRSLWQEWHSLPLSTQVPVRAVFFRQLMQNPSPGQVPSQWSESGRGDDAAFVLRENGLRYAVHLLDGYSPGLFPDQRANRLFLREKLMEFGPGARVLNTFAYTGAFSVTAAAAGAETLTVDLSKRHLDQARANFALNDLPPEAHRWMAEDVLTYLPRLQRRGETFHFILLDPPTFSRNRSGRIFRAEKDYPHLLKLALSVAADNAWIFLSTNCRSINAPRLRQWARELRPDAHIVPGQYPPDFLRGPRATTLWMRLAGKPHESSLPTPPPPGR